MKIPRTHREMRLHEGISKLQHRFASMALATFALVLAPVVVMAQSAYPSKPIRIIVPFSVGSGVDIVARGVAQQLSKQLSTPVYVDNREGAGGLVGSPAVQTAEPDGYTLLFTVNPPFVVQPLLQVKPGYDATKFTPVGKVGSVAMVLATSGKSSLKTFEEAAAAAEKNPGKLSYAHTGTGTLSYLAMERILKERGLKIVDVPYKSAAQSLTDTISGVVDLEVRSLPGVVSHAASGQLRLLAVGNPTRLPSLPDVPTMAEVLRKPGFEAVVWYAMFGPPGMNPEHVRKLNVELNKAIATPVIKELLERATVEASHSTAEELGALVRNEADSYKRLLNEIGVKPQ